MMLDPTNRDDYKLATALRGPDNNNDDLKALFTAVIRHYVIGSPEKAKYEFPGSRRYSYSVNGMLVNTVANARSYYIDRVVEDDVDTHFLQHARDAFTELDKRLPEEGLKIYFNWALERIPNLNLSIRGALYA